MFHKNVIRDIAQEMRPAVYVELGVLGGDTFKTILPYTSCAFACDVSPESREHVEPNNPKVRFYGMTTDDFADIWKNEIRLEVDMIFIDACHNEKNVTRDAQNFYQFLKQDTGLMFLHDTWPPNIAEVDPNRCGDAYLSKKKLLSTLDNCEMVTLPCQYGLSIIRKVGDNWRNG